MYNKTKIRKAIVIDPIYKELYNKEFYIVGENNYFNSLHEKCTWYNIADSPNFSNTFDVYLYMGPKQIKILDA